MTDQQWHDEAMRLLAICVDSCFDYEIGDGSRRYDELEALAAHLRARPSAEPMPVAQGEREAFEAWADDQGFPLDRSIHSDGENYRYLRTQGPWDAWQAARATAPRARELEEALQRIVDWDAAGMLLTEDHIANARAVLAAAGKD